MNKLTALFSALKAGNELANSSTWKNRQAFVAALVALAGAGLVLARSFGFPLDVSSEDVAAIAGGLASVFGLFNGYLAMATSARVGLSGASEPDAAAGGDSNGGNPPDANGTNTGL